MSELPRDVKLVRNDSSAILTKAGSKYTILYENHDYGPNYDLVPQKFDGFFPETADNYLKDPVATINQWTHRRSNLYGLLEFNRIPVFFTDLAFSYPYEGVISSVEIGVIAAEAIGGLKSFSYGFKRPRQSTLDGRRNLLKVGALLGGSYLISPALSVLGGIGSTTTEKFADSSAGFTKFSQSIHPEVGLFFMHLREALIAYKEEWIGMNLFDKPHFVNLIGAVHVGLEKRLEATLHDKLKFLECMSPIVRQMIPSEIFYKVPRMDFNGRSWQLTDTIDIPELKELMK